MIVHKGPNKAATTLPFGPVRAANAETSAMLYNLLGENTEGEFHALKIVYGGVVVKVMDVGAHEFCEYGGENTIEQDLGGD